MKAVIGGALAFVVVASTVAVFFGIDKALDLIILSLSALGVFCLIE